MGRCCASSFLATEATVYGSLSVLSIPRSSTILSMRENSASRAPRRLSWPEIGKAQRTRHFPERKGRRSHATSQMHPIVPVEDEKGLWEESKQLITSLNFSREEADALLGKAFGWVHSPYWGEERKKEMPRNEGVKQLMDFLRNLGLSDGDLYKLLKKFPEVLGCSLDDEVKLNVSLLENEWGIKGKTLRSLLLRNPKVLGYKVDCKGDCIAQCTRCWARF